VDNLPAVDEAAPLGELVECAACHNGATGDLDIAIFPSREAELASLEEGEEALGGCVEETGVGGVNAICMGCHQGRSSTDDVNADIAAAGVGDDEVSTELGFINQHYYAAAATLFAGKVRGGYQYAGKVYDWRFRHVPSADLCTGCHDPHSLQIKEDACISCHENADLSDWDAADGLEAIRAVTSRSDYDGDGLCPSCEAGNEGIAGEIETLREMIYEAIQAYATEQGNPICRGSRYPYYFEDAEPTGGPCGDEDTVRYESWTPRLVRAAYNFQSASVDPGNFAHNAKYTIQLLYDSIENLNEALTTPIDLSGASRVEPGHFPGLGMAGRTAVGLAGDDEPVETF